MRFNDYSKWIWNEVRDSKIFTLLNVTGVWINTCIVLLFLCLSLGVEEATINRITAEVDLFTLEVNPRVPIKDIYLSEFSAFVPDSRQNTIIPVLAKFVELGVNTESSGTIQNTAKLSNTFPTYTENFYSFGSLGNDPRTASLHFVLGRNLNRTDNASVVLSMSTFERLSALTRQLSQKNFDTVPLVLVATRYNANVKETKIFNCKIVGVAQTTPHSGALTYISFDLAEQIDDWTNLRAGPQDYTLRPYVRIDIVANDLQSLEGLRTDIQSLGYSTSSVLDRIDNVKQVLQLVAIVFFGILAIAILIAGFNIIITLTTYVLKRQKEIGILKAVGATDRQIQIIFVIHAIFLSALGSLLGTATALVIIQIIRFFVANIDNLKGVELFKIDFLYIGWIVLGSIFLSIIASLAPANKAASITPIETLREG